MNKILFKPKLLFLVKFNISLEAEVLFAVW